MSASWQQSRSGCIEAIILQWLHRGNNLVMAASRQLSLCGYIDSKISLLLHLCNNLVVAASKQESRQLHRGNNHVVVGSRQQSCGCRETTISSWLHRCISLLLYRANPFVYSTWRYQSRRACNEATTSSRLN